jgi:hypothetical protein
MDPLAHLHRHGDDAVWTATGHERPVFLDEHGKRRRWVLLGGALAGGGSACWLGALVAGAIGFSSLPSMNTDTHLLAARAHARYVAQTVVAQTVRHRHGRSKVSGRSSGLEHADLAVSRGVLPLP